MKISEIITDKYKLRIPPTIYYELLADVVEAEDEQEPTNKDLTCAYAKGVYDTREETATIIDKIKADVLDNAFSVVNPKNTYEYINVLNLDSIEKILDKYKEESEDKE